MQHIAMRRRWECLCNDAKIEEISLKKRSVSSDKSRFRRFFFLIFFGANQHCFQHDSIYSPICNYSSSFGSVRKKERKNGIVTAADKISAIDCEISIPNRPRLCDRIRMTGTKMMPLLVQARKNARPLFPML